MHGPRNIKLTDLCYAYAMLQQIAALMCLNNFMCNSSTVQAASGIYTEYVKKLE